MMDHKSAAKIAHDIADGLKQRNQRYTDRDFPCDNRSLFNDKAKHVQEKDANGVMGWRSEYDWHRLTDIAGGDPVAKVFVDVRMRVGGVMLTRALRRELTLVMSYKAS
jgi:hypothetical protein